MNNFEEKTKKQGTSKPEASNEKVNGDMAWEEELEQDDVQLATDELAGVVGGGSDCGCGGGGYKDDGIPFGIFKTIPMNYDWRKSS